ncbi:MAG: selenide, water dikinase SelD [Solirubrobacteraceae bacterium]
MAIALTSLSHGAGCGCKIGAADLEPIVAAIPLPSDSAVLVGPHTADDAGVYRLRDDLALIHTADFFTPIVDDPYAFGRIAATNALSDVYAMGGEPVTALNLVAFSLEELGADVLREILRGGAEVAAAAGVAIVGGHSIDDREPKYGMAVTGVVHPDAVLTNAGGRAGDALVLTKPVGAGAITTAAKRNGVDTDVLAAAIEVMATLNDAAAAGARAAGAHAVTDVTGFGLVGHLHELAKASGVASQVDAGAVPAIPGALALLEEADSVSGGSRRNRVWAETFANFDEDVPEPRRRLACDAMTSGGLLIALPPDRADELGGAIVGRLVDGPAGHVTVSAK